jgi:hypothetical protein
MRRSQEAVRGGEHRDAERFRCRLQRRSKRGQVRYCTHGSPGQTARTTRALVVVWSVGTRNDEQLSR